MRSQKAILLFIANISIAASVFAQLSPFDSGHLYSVRDLKEDFNYFKKRFENSDPALYLYTSKQDFDSYCDSLSATIVQPTTARVFYNLLTLLNTKLMDGHVHIFPNPEFIRYQNQQGVFLPFHITCNGEHLYIDMNNTYDRSIAEGDELISINGEKAPAIIRFLLMHQIRDGYNQTYPRWILNNWFKEYYGFHFGYPASFQIELQSHDGLTKRSTIKALLKDSIRFYQKKYYSTRKNSGDGEGLILQFDGETETAMLKIKSFDNEMLKDIYHQEFGKTISGFFDRIREKKSKHLILDLRDNQGGEVENGSLLISHLLDTHFVMVGAYYKISNTQSGNMKDRIVNTTGPSMGPQQPDVQPFTGKLLILVNGGSFSNTGIVAAALAHYRRGEFIGEETGGNSNIICGDAESDSLPHSGIAFEIPTVIYEMRDRQLNKGHGTIPHCEITSSIKDIISNTDVVMEKAWTLIKKNP
jgi:hypothetical protein